MYDNKAAIADASKFIEAQPVRERGYPIEEIAPIVRWINLRLDYERDFGVGDQVDQFEWFNFLLGIGRDKRTGGTQSLGRLMLTGWSNGTSNLYGVAYREGHKDGHITGSFFTTRRAAIKAEKTALRAKQAMSQRATNGRRLIGATSRAKVKDAAEAFRHLSKSNASYEMADIVNLDPGTIKRYLSELFPGDEWKS